MIDLVVNQFHEKINENLANIVDRKILNFLYHVWRKVDCPIIYKIRNS